MQRSKGLKRRTPLTQGSGLKRTPMKRRPPPRKPASAEEIAWKRPHTGRCANCGAEGDMQRHHVLYKQALRAAGAPQWDPRCALELGWPWVCDCHELHHSASKRIPLAKLTDENFEFALEVLGAAMAGYLRRRYDGYDARLGR